MRGFLQFPTGVGSGVGLTVASTAAELSRESGYVHEGTDSRGEGGRARPGSPSAGFGVPLPRQPRMNEGPIFSFPSRASEALELERRHLRNTF